MKCGEEEDDVRQRINKTLCTKYIVYSNSTLTHVTLTENRRLQTNLVSVHFSYMCFLTSPEDQQVCKQKAEQTQYVSVCVCVCQLCQLCQHLHAKLASICLLCAVAPIWEALLYDDIAFLKEKGTADVCFHHMFTYQHLNVPFGSMWEIWQTDHKHWKYCLYYRYV